MDQAAEVAELDQLGGGPVRGRQFRQGLVEGQHVFARLGGQQLGLFQGQARGGRRA
jgi:hypothetical protein